MEVEPRDRIMVLGLQGQALTNQIDTGQLKNKRASEA
jgi:hypothetical protein